MKTTNNKSLGIAFVVIVALFLLFSGGAMSGELMNGGIHGSGWMVNEAGCGRLLC